jgi:putative transposase
MTLYEGHRVETARLRGWDYRGRGWYFVTICTRQHVCTLGEVSGSRVELSPIGLAAAAELKGLPDHYPTASLDCDVVMPNRVHAIIVLEGPHIFSPGTRIPAPNERADFPLCAPKAISLSSIVRAYKAGVTRWCRTKGYDWFAWQPGFYDRILRSNASVNAVRDYIRRNPANWLFDRDHPRNISAGQQET